MIILLRQDRIHIFSRLIATVVVALFLSVVASAQGPDQKDYLSSLEADKIRDAETPNARVTLFLTYAEDRLKKFQYELAHPALANHAEILNGMMNGYQGCVDDAADLIQLGLEKQQNVRQGIDLMASKTKEFLVILQKIQADAVDIDIYKNNLDDAIDGTTDAMNEAEKAKKKVAPPPVRRRN
ncbi:MAG TPA: hypothetical protein VE545_06995 [Candidatus Dormibacteraeota bacterium]|nr:hypothetical protein [Candidatus Dormibacteraeota bacterium]